MNKNITSGTRLNFFTIRVLTDAAKTFHQIAILHIGIYIIIITKNYDAVNRLKRVNGWAKIYILKKLSEVVFVIRLEARALYFWCFGRGERRWRRGSLAHGWKPRSNGVGQSVSGTRYQSWFVSCRLSSYQTVRGILRFLLVLHLT